MSEMFAGEYAGTDVDGASTGPTAAGPLAEPAAPTVTGAWAERVAALDALTDRPLTEHVEAYDALHTDLRRRLGEVDGA